jgi:hypothetical protein
VCGAAVAEKNKDHGFAPWRRGAVDIATASGTRRPGFESRQGIRFLGKHSSAVVYKITYIICIVCVLKRRNKGIGHKNIFKKKITGSLPGTGNLFKKKC